MCVYVWICLCRDSAGNSIGGFIHALLFKWVCGVRVCVGLCVQRFSRQEFFRSITEVILSEHPVLLGGGGGDSQMGVTCIPVWMGG